MTPLSGIRILDLTRLLPGAYATLLLADLGADVIKLEDPRGGDPIRSMPPLADGHGSVYHYVLNRGKRSVTLDLRSSEARPLLDLLLERADVLVESFRPQTARKLRITAGDLAAAHPRLVHCSITGFGQTGPYAERAGHDINYVALAGLLALDRPSNAAPPHMPRMFLADIGGGAMSAVTGILAALLARERTGRGAAVDISMHEGALSWLTVPAARVLAGARDIEPADLPITGREACYNIYQASDGEYLALGALEPKFWSRFCERVGRSDWIALQFAQGDVQAAMLAEMAALLRTRPRQEWLDLFVDVDVCLTPVNTVSEALEDPHAVERGAVLRHGPARLLRPGIRVSATGPVDFDDELASTSGSEPVTAGSGSAFAAAALRDAPAVGADTDEVFRACGVPARTLADLRARGVI